MLFWEAMREMQENKKRVRCLRWNRRGEEAMFWELGSDIQLPTGLDWEDCMEDWVFYQDDSIIS